jgi:hypothetical protein
MTEWKDFEKELPPFNKLLLIYVRSGFGEEKRFFVCTGEYTRHSGWWFSEKIDGYKRVVEWAEFDMPIDRNTPI